MARDLRSPRQRSTTKRKSGLKQTKKRLLRPRVGFVEVCIGFLVVKLSATIDIVLNLPLYF